MSFERLDVQLGWVTVATFRSSLKCIEQEFSKVSEAMDKLAHDWEGVSQKELFQDYERVNQNAQEVVEAMEYIQDKLSRIIQSFVHLDEGVI